MNPPLRPSDFIGELCVALAHRWEPEWLFVIFTGHFDEADTHGPAPTVVMAGFVGHAYQWRRFETKLARLQARDGFTIFHAAQFKAKRGQFEGWSDEKCQRLVWDLTELVRSTLTEGITVALERERYLTEYRSPPIPRKMNLDSQYGVCFRACLSRLLEIMAARGNRDTLNVILEHGHPNAGNCETIFFDLKKHLERTGVRVLGSFATDLKESCPPLMACDFLAATYSMMRADDQAALGQYIELAPEPGPGEAGLSFMTLRPDALTGLKTGFEALRQRGIDEWRARRDARKLSSSAGRLPS
jgi:hypothetical protein